MGYLGVYIWRRSTVLDLILGGMLEELSSVKPVPDSWLPRKIASFNGDKEAVEIEYRHMISVAH